MFIVLKTFADLEDDRYIYNKGDVFPREGKKVSLKRQEELLGSNNKVGEPLIIEKKVKKATKEEPKEEPVEEPKEEPKPKKDK